MAAAFNPGKPGVPGDRRLTPANGRVADSALCGRVQAKRFVEPMIERITDALVDLAPTPGGKRDRQLLLGEAIRVYETRADTSFVQVVHDGYVGYIPAACHDSSMPPTHHVASRGTHLYAEPDMKSRDLAWLSFGARLHLIGRHGDFLATDGGYIHAAHMAPVDRLCDDPVRLSRMFLDVPYLWGGNSTMGIDCSGLVQAVLRACGVPCPADSDLQSDAFDPVVGMARAGDLIFWTDHVAMLTTAGMVIHANATHMAVKEEPLSQVQARIDRLQEGTEGSLVTRPPWPASCAAALPEHDPKDLPLPGENHG